MYNPFTSGPARPRQSLRNARGRGWHKKGYRDMGCMWINVRRGSYGHTRGMDINENATIADMWNQIVRSIEMEDGSPLPEDWSIDLSSNRRSIVPSEEPVKTIFDGGENIYVKIFDEDGQQRVYDFFDRQWVYHTPGKPIRFQDRFGM